MCQRPLNTCQLKFGLSYLHLHGIIILLGSHLDLYRARLFEKVVYNGIYNSSSNWAVSSWLIMLAVWRLSPLSGSILFRRWAWKITRALNLSEKCCHSGSINLWKEYRNIKVCLQGITLCFAKRSVLTLKTIEYFHWQK